MIFKSKIKIEQIRATLSLNPYISSEFEIIEYRKWRRFKESYLATRTSVILLIDTDKKKAYKETLKELRHYYQEIYLVKDDMKDYCLNYLKNRIINIYESI